MLLYVIINLFLRTPAHKIGTHGRGNLTPINAGCNTKRSFANLFWHVLLWGQHQDDILSLLLLNLKPAAVFKQAVTKQEKTSESCGMLRNTCLTHSTSQQVNWQQVMVSRTGLKGRRLDWAYEFADGREDILLRVQETEPSPQTKIRMETQKGLNMEEKSWINTKSWVGETWELCQSRRVGLWENI